MYLSTVCSYFSEVVVPTATSALPLELEAPAQVSQSVNVFVQHAVDRRHISRHIPVPGEISEEVALLRAEDKLLGQRAVPSDVLPHGQEQQPHLERSEAGEGFVHVGQHGRQELPLPHAGHEETRGLQVPRGVGGQALARGLPVGEQRGQEAPEHRGAVAEGGPPGCHHLEQGEEHRVGLEATADVDVSLHRGAGVLLGGPGQLAVGHVRTHVFHQRHSHDLGSLGVDWRRLVGVGGRSGAVDGAVETGGAAALDDHWHQSLDVLWTEEWDRLQFHSIFCF